MRLDALVGDAGADDFGQAVDIDGMHVERLLDLAAHGVGPRLGAEDADLERASPRVDILRVEFVEDRQHVARRHHDDVGLEIGDEVNLPLGHAAGHRDDGAAEPLGAVMRAEAAGEQAVAIGDVDLHARPAAAGADAARADVGPGADVVTGVADDGRLAGRARRGVQANDLLTRHRKHAERIICAQIGLGGEREFRKVGKLLQVAGINARLLEGAAIMRHVVVGVIERPFEALELQRRDLIARRDLDRIEVLRAGREIELFGVGGMSLRTSPSPLGERVG